MQTLITQPTLARPTTVAVRGDQGDPDRWQQGHHRPPFKLCRIPATSGDSTQEQKDSSTGPGVDLWGGFMGWFFDASFP